MHNFIIIIVLGYFNSFTEHNVVSSLVSQVSSIPCPVSEEQQVPCTTLQESSSHSTTAPVER